MKKSISYKRSIITVLTIAMVCAAFAGCADAAVSETGTIPSDTAAPTVTPSPPPKEGVEAVFDKQITIAAVSNGSEEDSSLFFEGAQAEAKNLGVTLNTSAAGDGFDSAFSSTAADAVIACLVKEQPSYAALDTAAGKGLPVTVFEMKNGSVSSSVSHIYYAPESETQTAFDAALTYPPHDTPVRLILMFKSKETESYKLYLKLYSQGKIFPKEVYIESQSKSKAGEWLNAKLKKYIAGMLDGVYAEDTGLAVNALDTLEALKRTDMEVFCPGLTSETVDRMEKNPDVFAQSAGANMYLAGVLSVRAALKQLKGEGSSTLEMKPAVFNASDFAQNGMQAFVNGENAATFNTGWMEELRQYYKTAN